MRKPWKKTITAAMISVSLMTSGYAAYAAEAVPAVHDLPSYPLADHLQVELKSLLNERTAGGIRIGAVIRMSNDSDKITRVPEYEVRVTTTDGVSYTLQPSASNPRSLQPKATVELSYLCVIDRSDEISLSKLSWVDVDEYVYPKKETPILALDVASLSWKGTDSTIEDPEAIMKWGEVFRIPAIDSPLQYSPVDISDTMTQTGPVTVVKMQVANPTDKKETVPDFSLDGKSASKTYPGKRVEAGPVTLEPQEKKEIHFAIPTDADARLTSLNVVTPESYTQIDAQGKASVVQYTIGRLNVLLPEAGLAQQLARLPEYTFGTPIKLSLFTDKVDPNLTTSLVDMRFYENEGKGYQTAVAKVVLDNKGDKPLILPPLAAEIVTPEGYRYSSIRPGGSSGTQAGGSAAGAALQQIMPNTKTVVTYAFLMPESEKPEQLAVKLQDTLSAAPYTSTLTAFKISLPEEKLNRDPIAFYPFEVRIKDYSINTQVNSVPSISYNYRLHLNLEINQVEEVAVDPSLTQMEFDLLDQDGNTMATLVRPLIGTGKLARGIQDLYFNNVGNEYMNNMSINVYETITTPAGPVKRLVAQLKQ